MTSSAPRASGRLREILDDTSLRRTLASLCPGRWRAAGVLSGSGVCPYLDPGPLARYPLPTIRSGIRRGAIPCSRIGRAVLVRLSDVQALLACGRPQPVDLEARPPSYSVLLDPLTLRRAVLSLTVRVTKESRQQRDAGEYPNNAGISGPRLLGHLPSRGQACASLDVGAPGQAGGKAEAGIDVPTIAALMGLTTAHVLEHYVKPSVLHLVDAMQDSLARPAPRSPRPTFVRKTKAGATLVEAGTVDGGRFDGQARPYSVAGQRSDSTRPVLYCWPVRVCSLSSSTHPYSCTHCVGSAVRTYSNGLRRTGSEDPFSAQVQPVWSV